MNLHRSTRAVLLLSVSALPSFAVQQPRPPAPAPAPAPAPSPRPAPTPAPTPAETEAQREEKAKQERIERARRAEAERLKQEQEAERIKHAREAEAERVKQEQDAKRVKRAREEAANAPTPPASSAAQRAELTATARDMLAIEDVHRDRLARIERLLAVYGESGDGAKLEEVGKLKAKENKRYGLIMAQFKEKLGPAYAQFEPQLLAGQKPLRTAQPQPAGSPPPVPRREAKRPVKDEKSGGGQ